MFFLFSETSFEITTTEAEGSSGEGAAEGEGAGERTAAHRQTCQKNIDLWEPRIQERYRHFDVWTLFITYQEPFFNAQELCVWVCLTSVWLCSKCFTGKLLNTKLYVYGWLFFFFFLSLTDSCLLWCVKVPTAVTIISHFLPKASFLLFLRQEGEWRSPVLCQVTWLLFLNNLLKMTTVL